ncbi:MAG: hypothetical protein PUP93_18365 [Rhizonema sp. NSF051]|nr:hypothetical protein [Rhizonema sp. NSF051]
MKNLPTQTDYESLTGATRGQGTLAGNPSLPRYSSLPARCLI